MDKISRLELTQLYNYLSDSFPANHYGKWLKNLLGKNGESVESNQVSKIESVQPKPRT